MVLEYTETNGGTNGNTVFGGPAFGGLVLGFFTVIIKVIV